MCSFGSFSNIVVYFTFLIVFLHNLVVYFYTHLHSALIIFIRFSRCKFKFLFQKFMVGLSGLEPPTSRLSGVRSNRLSYKPIPRLSALTPSALKAPF